MDYPLTATIVKKHSGRDIVWENILRTIENNSFISRSRNVLNGHISKQHKCTNIHGRSESLVCSDCGKLFSSSKQIKNHKYNVHPKIKDKYECEQCLQKFPYAHVLDKHKVRNHSGERFVCSNCNKSFTLRSNLLKHVKIFHGKSWKYLLFQKKIKCVSLCLTKPVTPMIRLDISLTPI